MATAVSLLMVTQLSTRGPAAAKIHTDPISTSGYGDRTWALDKSFSLIQLTPLLVQECG